VDTEKKHKKNPPDSEVKALEIVRKKEENRPLRIFKMSSSKVDP
jgi:hypothetical protein